MGIFEIEKALSEILGNLFDKYDEESIEKLSFIDLFYLYCYIYMNFNVKLSIQEITEDNLSVKLLSKHIYDRINNILS